MISIDNLILPASYSFPILNFLTLLLIYAKNSSDLYMRWSLILFPTCFYIVLQIILSLKDLFFLETHEIQFSMLEIKLILSHKFAKIILGAFSLIFYIFLSEYLEFLDYPPDPKPDFSISHLYVLAFFILFFYLVYSIIVRKMMQNERESSASNNEKINLFSIFLNSLFSILGNTTTICSTGVCSSIYISTVSAFFSAFVITIVDWLPYIRYSAVIFIAISVFSLYSAKKSLLYGPFLLSLFGSIMILVSMMYLENNYLLYVGNILMIFAAYRNAKINKAGFGKKKKEQV